MGGSSTSSDDFPVTVGRIRKRKRRASVCPPVSCESFKRVTECSGGKEVVKRRGLVSRRGKLEEKRAWGQKLGRNDQSGHHQSTDWKVQEWFGREEEDSVDGTEGGGSSMQEFIVYGEEEVDAEEEGSGVEAEEEDEAVQDMWYLVHKEEKVRRKVGRVGDERRQAEAAAGRWLTSARNEKLVSKLNELKAAEAGRFCRDCCKMVEKGGSGGPSKGS